MPTIRLPFDSNGQDVAVTQGPGEGSHADISQLYTSWDFALPIGSEVLAVADGVIEDIRATVPDGAIGTVLPNMDGDGDRSNDDPSLGSGGIGNIVTIRHEVAGQTFYSSYFHLAENSIPFTPEEVAAGTATVSAGDVIGLTGLTGSREGVSGAHLHFQVGREAGFFGVSNYGGGTGDNGRPQFIATADPSSVGLVSFEGYGATLPSTVIGPEGSTGSEPTIIFSDDFNRSNSQTVGNGWTEVQETAPEDPGFVGFSQVGVSDGQLLFYYDRVDGPRPLTGINYEPPYIKRTLEEDVSQKKATLSFDFTPGDDARFFHFVGLSDASQGEVFRDSANPPFFPLVPESGIGLLVGRSSSDFDNSTVRLVEYSTDSAGRFIENVLIEEALSFQMNPGETYTAIMEITPSSTITISVGADTFSFDGDVSGLTLSEIVVSSIGTSPPFGDQTEAFNIDNITVATADGGIPTENEAPSLNISEPFSQAFSIPENTTFIAGLNASDDIDAEGSGLTYSLSGSSADLLTVDQSTGNISFIDAPDFEYPFDSITQLVTNFGISIGYEFTVTVTDSGGLNDSAEFFVRVTNVDDDPIVPSGWDRVAQVFDFSDLLDDTGAGFPLLVDGNLRNPFKMSSQQQQDFLTAIREIYETSSVARVELDKFADNSWEIDVRGISNAGSRHVPDRDAIYIDFDDRNSLIDDTLNDFFLSKNGTFVSLSFGTVLYHELMHAIDDFEGRDAPAVENGLVDYTDASFNHLGNVVDKTNLVRVELGEDERGGYPAGSFDFQRKTEIENFWQSQNIDVSGQYDQVLYNPSLTVDTSSRDIDGRDSDDLVMFFSGSEAVSGQSNIATGGGADSVVGLNNSPSNAGDVISLGGGDDRAWGLGGNDVVNGGTGSDTSIYRHSITSYSVYLNADGSIIVDQDGFPSDPEFNDGTDILTDVEFAQFSDSILDLSTVKDIVLQPNEAATIRFTIEEFDGIQIRSFDAGDALQFVNVNFGEQSLTVTYGSAILDIDYDLDGVIDSTVTLEGNFEGAEFNVEAVGDDTFITVEFPPMLNLVEGTAGSNRLVGTDGADAFRSLGGSYDRMTGGEGADQFIFGSETSNGVRERDVIMDYEVGSDSIVLEAGTSIASIRETSSQVVVFLDGDRDAIYVRGEGVTADNLTIISDDVFESV